MTKPPGKPGPSIFIAEQPKRTPTYVGDVLLFWAGPKKEKMLLLFASPWNQAKEASSKHDIHVLSVEALSGLLLAIPLVRPLRAFGVLTWMFRQVSKKGHLGGKLSPLLNGGLVYAG